MSGDPRVIYAVYGGSECDLIALCTTQALASKLIAQRIGYQVVEFPLISKTPIKIVSYAIRGRLDGGSFRRKRRASLLDGPGVQRERHGDWDFNVPAWPVVTTGRWAAPKGTPQDYAEVRGRDPKMCEQLLFEALERLAVSATLK
jgi:hypothetical protein